jgi:hypothetical protein
MSIRFSHTTRCWLLSLAAIAVLFGALPGVAQADSWSDARVALQSLESYLNRYPNGPGWREFLQLKLLSTELNKNNAADRKVINSTIDALNSGVPGLDLPRFAALRKALYGTLLSSRADLPSAFAASKGSFRPITEAEVQTARKNLEQKLAALRSYLVNHPSTGGGWSKYLLLDEMTKELAKGDKTDPEVFYYDYLPLYTQGHAGLEAAQIRETGQAIHAFADVLTAKKNPEASIHHTQRIGELSELAAKLAAEKGNVDTSSFADLLGQLAANRQNPELVAAARRLYSEPNVIFLAKKNLIATAMSNHIDEVAPLTDTILGTAIRGTSHTRANTYVNLRNNPSRAEIDLNLVGNVTSRTAGFNGPAVVYSNGNTSINGHKLLWLDADGWHTENNASASAKTNTTFTGFGATRGLFKGLITNVASQRAQQSKGTAEMIAASHAADRVENRLDAQAPALIANANRDMRKNFRGPLDRWGIFPEDIRFSSDTQAIHGRALAANSYQLGAPLPPPKVEFRGNHDIELRLHETAINNSAFTAFAGRTVTRQEVEGWFKRNNNKVPDELQDEEQRDWSIVLDDSRPLHMTIADGGFEVEIRGTKWTSGENTYPAMNVKAKYKLEVTPAGVKAVRQGELDITPPDYKPGAGLTNEQTYLKRILARRFEKILKPEIAGEGIQLKGRLANYGKLYVRMVNSQNGWLQAALGK